MNRVCGLPEKKATTGWTVYRSLSILFFPAENQQVAKKTNPFAGDSYVSEPYERHNPELTFGSNMGCAALPQYVPFTRCTHDYLK